MGKQVPPGFGKNVATQFMECFEEIGLAPRVKGPLAGFFPGSSDVNAREQALLGWMNVRGSGPFAGTPVLKVARGRLPKLEKQIRQAKIDTDTGKRNIKLDQDLVVCLEYGAGFAPKYHPPEKQKEPEEVDMRAAFLKKMEHSRNRNPRSPRGVSLGAGVEVG
jgi:hypothetical protein